MSLFGGKGKKEKGKDSPSKNNNDLIDNVQTAPSQATNRDSSVSRVPSTPATEVNKASKMPSANANQAEQQPGVQPARPKLVFHCQQAQGSPTGVISNFINVKELYQKIADCYDFDPSQVIDMLIYVYKYNTHTVELHLNVLVRTLKMSTV